MTNETPLSIETPLPLHQFRRYRPYDIFKGEKVRVCCFSDDAELYEDVMWAEVEDCFRAWSDRPEGMEHLKACVEFDGLMFHILTLRLILWNKESVGEEYYDTDGHQCLQIVVSAEELDLLPEPLLQLLLPFPNA